MQRFPIIPMLAATLLALLTAPVAVQAQTVKAGAPPECRQQDRKCPPPGQQPGPDRKARGHDGAHDGGRDAGRGDRREVRRDHPPAPRVGADGRAGRHWTPPRDSRLPPAPRGREYRVIGDHLVLVDRQSQRVVSVVVPLRAR